MSNCHNSSNSHCNCTHKVIYNNCPIPEPVPVPNKYYAKFNVNYYPITSATLDLSNFYVQMTQDFGTNNLIKLTDPTTITLAAGYIYSISYVLLNSSLEAQDTKPVTYAPIQSYIQITPELSTLPLAVTLASSTAYGALLDPDSGFNGNLTCAASFITNAAETSNSTLKFLVNSECLSTNTIDKIDLNGSISIFPIAKL